MSDYWLELHVDDDQLRDVYARADQLGALSIHHFTEPWVTRWAVRVLLPDDGISPGDFGVPGSVWNATPDEELFGDAWPEVRSFFEASSRLGLRRGGKDQAWYDNKVIHCVLNSWGFDIQEEVDFAAYLLKDRKTMRKREKDAAKAKAA